MTDRPALRPSATAPGVGRGLYDPKFEHDSCGIGFVAHTHGVRSRDIITKSLALLRNLSHRSATGGDPTTGDGAGILLQIPHAFLRRECAASAIGLPDAGEYGVGMLFLPHDPDTRQWCAEQVERAAIAERCRVLGWRDVPVDDRHAGNDARRARPVIRQVFIVRAGLDSDVSDSVALERSLYRIRRRIEAAALHPPSSQGLELYVASLSSRTVVYKGMLRPDQLSLVYPDLSDDALVSALAVVHSRFSTNTFPSWDRAHPYRMICHNGEINTLRGNLNWMRVREPMMRSAALAVEMPELFPIIADGQSDSASLDNALELLVTSGRSLAHAMMMLIPEAWENDGAMDAERRAFYDYHASLMEPWDGPAAIVFTDGRQIGATLDRNGLRPARYVVTDDDLVILASEAGALEVPVEAIRAKGRLHPGKMLLVNTTQGRVLDDEELKSEVARLRPYRRWVEQQRVTLPVGSMTISHRPEAELVELQRAFGYTREDLSMILGPMASTGEEPVGSMGNDTPLAVLSDRPRLLFSYFRQLFAQVTNPAIDPIRERLVMSTSVRLGPQGNLLEETPELAHHLRLDRPLLDEAQLASIQRLDDALTSTVLSTLFRAERGPRELGSAVDAVCGQAERAVRSGADILILSDRGANRTLAAIPSLLAVSAVHHHLVQCELRARSSIVVETAEAREVAHVAMLVAYGAAAVSPYLALETVDQMARDGVLPPGIDGDMARGKYITALEKGLLKVLSKMGISTVQSYCGAQLFEAVGIAPSLIDRHFAGTSTRIGGIDIETLGEETLRRHAEAWEQAEPHDATTLGMGGDYHYRARGERHLWNPRTIATLQHATRSGNAATFREFSRIADDDAGEQTLRGRFDLVPQTPIPLDEVEPVTEIVRRFVTGAMSFGSLSREAHETLAVAMNHLGARSNTGEGGEERDRFGTRRNSAIKQVASARFGVTTEYLVSADELQIKIAQGAKPGEGGQLPGYKVDEVIARTRCSTPGVTLISPPPHHDIYSIEDLAQLIHDLRRVNPRARISVKLVAAAGVGTIAAGVAKAGADVIVISGDAGGTGASPLSSIKHAGVPWELGLAETQQTLTLNQLRSRVRVQTDGQLKTGRDVVVAALLGADEFGFATAPLIAQGCVMMRKCHLNTCPVGIATQDPELRAKFNGKPEHVINYFFFVADEVRTYLARLGARRLGEIVGRTDLLQTSPRASTWKARTLSLGDLLHRCEQTSEPVQPVGFVAPDDELDARILALASPALERGERVAASLSIRNVNRTTGAALAGEIARRCGADGLPDDTVTIRLSGSAGQSFGAFATRGLTLELSGEANDYVGKGLSGGRLVVRAPHGAKFLPERTIIVGNTVLYGATSGEAYFGGLAGERFAVRNSGAFAVVEGVGDHGCEYMTGGAVVVLGPTGRNFAAGMSGGIAFVLDEGGSFMQRCNGGMVELGPVFDAEDRALLHRLVERHATYTGSAQAKLALAHWEHTLRRFVCVMPLDYKHVRDGARALQAGHEAVRRG